MNTQEHWDNVYKTKDHTKVGWYQPLPEISLEILARIGASPEASVIDIGAGASTFVDALIRRGFRDIALLDISKEAFDIVKERLEGDKEIPTYLIEDITTASLPREYTLWHDRAVFHFLQEESEQQSYLQAMHDALMSTGYAIIGTFAVDGPESCSSLPVKQYDKETMETVLKNRFTIVEVIETVHMTPGGSEQKFSFFLLKPVLKVTQH